MFDCFFGTTNVAINLERRTIEIVVFGSGDGDYGRIPGLQRYCSISPGVRDEHAVPRFEVKAARGQADGRAEWNMTSVW